MTLRDRRQSGLDLDHYVGLVHPDAAKPDQKGEMAILFCGTDSVLGNEPTFDELGRMTVSTKPPKADPAVTIGCAQ